MKIGVIGDLHFKDRLGYADLVKDGREGEKELVLEQIYQYLSGCDAVIFMGDNLDSRNNSSKTLKDFVNFIERFPAEKVYILAGNHEKWANGRSAIDFLKQIKRPWQVITNEMQSFDLGELKVSFLPFMSRLEVEPTSNEDTSKILTDLLPGGDILFAHHAFTGISVNGGTKTDEFNEPVLDQGALKNKYGLTVIGHIHSSNKSDYPGFLLAGSVFCNELNEDNKSVWILDVAEDKKINVIECPIKQRKIIKIVNPTVAEIKSLDRENTIAKVEITDREINKSNLKLELDKCAGYTLIEKYFNQRKDSASEDVADYSIENMLKLYANAKKIDVEILLHGYELIKS